MELKRRKNKSKADVWFCEWWISGPDGKLRHQTQVIGPASGPGALSRKQALSLLSQLSIAISSARVAARSTGLSEFTSMTEAAAMWFAAKEADWSGSTRTSYTQQLRLHILPALGSRMVGQVFHRDTEALYQNLAAKGLSRGSIHQIRTIIGGMFSWLKRQDVEVHDVRADLPRRLAPGRETQVLTEEQIAAVVADTSWVGIASRAMLFCGLRPGEALALRHCDIEAGSLIIARASKRDGLGDTKSRRTRRVPVPPMLEAELRALPGGSEDLLFPRPRIGRGRADMLMSVSWLGRLVSERFGINPRQFRATFATLVSRDEVNVAAMLGHSSPRVTVKHYIKPLADESARAVAELERKLRRAG